MPKSPFLNDIRTTLRLGGYSLRTEKTYLYWIKFFIRFHKLKHPSEMGDTEVVRFLDYLANERHVAINTQKSALNALAYLYNQFLKNPLGELGFQHAKQGRRLPCVLSPEEVSSIIYHMNEQYQLIFSLLYGSGLRISECFRSQISKCI